MKVFVKKETNIIDVPEENSAILTEITRNNEYFRYEVTYRADPRRALQNGAITVRIQASTKPFVRQPTRLLTGFNPEQLIRNLQQKSSITKDQGRSQKSNVFFTYISDLSAKIPNDKTGLLSRDSIRGLLPDIILKKESTLKLKPVSELNEQNVIMPVLENNISTAIVPDSARNSTVAKAVSLDLALNAIDPARISGTRLGTVQPARKVSGGVVSMPSRELTKFNLNEKQKVSLLGNLVNTLNPNTHLQLRHADFVNVLVNQPRTTIDVTETLDIPVGLLQMDEFYLILSLVNKSGVEVQTINVTVPHAKNVAALQIPVLPPKMEILQTGLPGKNVIQVKQMDSNAVGCAIYRKEIRKGVPITDAAFTFVGNIFCKAGQDFQRMEDVVNNYNPILYRAVPFNTNGTLASEFASAGSKPVKPIGKAKILKRRNFVSLSGEIVDNAISVEIRDVPPGVTLVKLLRRDLSIFQETYDLAARPSLITNEDSLAPIFITDNTVKRGRIYEYQVELLYPDGDSEYGASHLVIKYDPITANVVETFVSKPEVVQTGTDLDVSFTLESSLIPGNLDSVKAALNAQGLSQFYDDAVSGERQKLQSIIAYNIQRSNLTTGEVEDFGTIITTQFSDKQFGRVKGVKPLQSGNEYRYNVTTFFRSAETALDTVEREVETGTSSTYTFQPARWLHPVTLNEGNLVSATSLTRNHAQTTFTFGSVGNVVSTIVSLADILPSIVEAKAQKLGKNSTLVQWRVQGNITKIDHFIVILEIVGMRTVVGKSHNVSESNFFQFVDSLDNGEHGKLTYSIIPVYYDFSRGTEVVTNEVLI